MSNEFYLVHIIYMKLQLNFKIFLKNYSSFMKLMQCKIEISLKSTSLISLNIFPYGEYLMT